MENSFLTRLSPELRNLLYEYIFTSDYAVTLENGRIFHPLTLTCRQLRQETLGLYLSLTSLNAHLDDGPIVPLVRWLRAMGPERCLLIRDVSIWDLHNLNGTLYGADATQRELRNGSPEGQPYVLRPVGRQLFYKNWVFKDIVLTLQSIGLGLARFCIVEEGDRLKETSRFAIMPSSELGGLESSAALAEEFGLSDKERASLVAQLGEGRREVRLLEGRRNIILNFDSAHRLTSIRQTFIPRDEEFYLEGDSAGVLGPDRIV